MSYDLSVLLFCPCISSSSSSWEPPSLFPTAAIHTLDVLSTLGLVTDPTGKQLILLFRGFISLTLGGKHVGDGGKRLADGGEVNATQLGRIQL